MYLPRTSGPATIVAGEPVAYTPSSGGASILLVEDEDLVLRYALRQLESLGYAVITARNGHDVLERLQKHPDVDLLFTDIIMPGPISCRELAEAAQRLNPAIKVL